MSSRSSRPRHLSNSLLVLAALVAGCAAPRERNVLLVTLDTVRADHVGAYGYAAATTPSLDRLAAEGVRFARAQAAAPLTLPSHATMLSGQLPPRHGLRQNGVPVAGGGLATLAGHLRGAGYRTGAFVGSFVLDRRFGLAAGFEHYDDEVERDVAATAGLEAERPGRVVVDRALAWLEARDERPFVVWVHLYDAHAPYEPPEPHASAHPGRPYDGEIAAVDAEVGRLLVFLRREDLLERTVVAVAGDHGEALGEHGEPTHGVLLYEASLQVPLLVAAPGLLRAGRVVEEPVGLVDLAPTLASLVGHPWTVEGGQGWDLSAALLRGEEPPRADLYAETEYPTLFGWSGLASLRRGERKYIAAPRPELYDLSRDPGEGTNLWRGGEGEAELVARLQSFVEGVRSSPSPAATALDAETRAKLESLGYVAPAAAAPAEAPEGRPDPKDRIALFRELEEARREMGEGLLPAAVARLEAIVAREPGNPVFRGTLAEARRRQGDREQAIALYRQAVAARPDDTETWYNPAVTLQEAGRPAEATVALTEVLRRSPQRPEAYNALGIALSLTGKPAEARAAFERAVALDPRDAKAWNNLGNALRDGGRLGEAEAAYRRAVELAPAYPDPWNGLGTVAVQANRPADALPLFDRAYALGPQLLEVLLNRAIALEVLGERERAAEGYAEFLAATAGGRAEEFAPQREAAARLLAQLQGDV